MCYLEWDTIDQKVQIRSIGGLIWQWMGSGLRREVCSTCGQKGLVLLFGEQISFAGILHCFEAIMQL